MAPLPVITMTTRIVTCFRLQDSELQIPNYSNLHFPRLHPGARGPWGQDMWFSPHQEATYPQKSTHRVENSTLWSLGMMGPNSSHPRNDGNPYFMGPGKPTDLGWWVYPPIIWEIMGVDRPDRTYQLMDITPSQEDRSSTKDADFITAVGCHRGGRGLWGFLFYLAQDASQHKDDIFFGDPG